MDEFRITRGFCRACLVRYEDVELTSYNEKNRRLFVYATGLQVKHNDNFVFQLCKNCVYNMKTASRFKKLCRTSDKRFKTFMEQKKKGSNVDFCNYIKNTDTSYMFRMAAMESSPCKTTADDKDETASTSTSIRNFMTDLLREEDIPATEAKIISQVIAEEADILEDSLDSHWLDDDDLTVNDDILDFSFSPFSTPKVESQERYSPFTDRNGSNENNELIANKYQFDVAVKTEILDLVEPNALCLENHVTASNIDGLLGDNKINIVQNMYLENQSPTNTIHISDDNQSQTTNKCVIDKNLAIALKNENDLIALDDLLKTPRAMSGASTPLINKLLFDNFEKPILDKDQYSNFDPDELLCGLEKTMDYESKETCSIDNGVIIEKKCCPDYEITTDVICKESNSDNNDKEPEQKVVTKADFDYKNFLCHLCNLKFKSVVGLKCHGKRKHDYHVPYVGRMFRKKQLMICDYCNKKMVTEKGNFIRHLRSHKFETKKLYKCKKCPSVFEKDSHLKTHSYLHMPLEKRQKALDDSRKYLCIICGTRYTTSAALRLHAIRHDLDKYKFKCTICNKPFLRKHDLKVHMRYHTGHNPFTCEKCNRSFKRRDEYSRHLLIHDPKFRCKVCEHNFPDEASYQKHVTRKRKCKRKVDKLKKTKKTIGLNTKHKVLDEQNVPVLDVSKVWSDNQYSYVLYDQIS